MPTSTIAIDTAGRGRTFSAFRVDIVRYTNLLT